jgi:GDP/UDP-N,N'-diacetylbacillosamine 2-epimerase (hydrolysing)
MRKIAVITGSRAEYGLLYGLIQNIFEDPALELQLLVTGMHLSPEFGFTVQQIEKDRLPIADKIEMLLSSDSETAIATSMGLGTIGFAKAYEQLQPDILVVLGDRFEIISGVTAAVPFKIPIAHIHGGESTEGAMDELFRHAITKMSHLHFTSTKEYRRRVIQLGELPNRVFNVGALGIENIRRMKLLSKEILESEIDFELKDQCILVTFHPVTLEKDTVGEQFQIILDVIDTFDDLRVIFTKTNADPYGRIINKKIDDYVANNREKALGFSSMGQLRYLSTMQYINAVVGNSSSGIIEAPCFNVPTVNVGDRQKGRVRAESVIDCSPDKDSFMSALVKALSIEFKIKIQETINPYEKANTAHTIIGILKKVDLQNIIKKQFYDNNSVT